MAPESFSVTPEAATLRERSREPSDTVVTATFEASASPRRAIPAKADSCLVLEGEGEGRGRGNGEMVF